MSQAHRVFVGSLCAGSPWSVGTRWRLCGSIGGRCLHREIDHGGTTSDWLRICWGLIYSVEIARAGGEDGGYGQCCEDFLVHGSDSFGVDVLV